jgi:putative endonuclease
MSFFVYIIYSAERERYLLATLLILDDRIFRHTNSGSKSTKKAGDWKLVYREEYATKSEAYKREIEIKKKKSRKYIDWLINSVPERSV